MVRRLLACGLALAAMVRAAEARADSMTIPVVRFALGPAFHLAPQQDPSTRIAADITAGFTYDGGSFTKGGSVGWLLHPELGYTYDGLGLNAFNATCGFGVGTLAVDVAYQPRLIVGTVDDAGAAVGMRNGIMLHAFVDIASVEVGHQFVRWGGAFHHDVRVFLGINPASIVWGIAGLLRQR
ncbi:MAG: hypothetical protein QM820_35105 [Minicystis sp.]